MAGLINLRLLTDFFNEIRSKLTNVKEASVSSPIVSNYRPSQDRDHLVPEE